MGACWHCYWGWPSPVADIYAKYLAKSSYEAMRYGPAHIVWEDENFDDGSLEFCLRACDNLDYWTGVRNMDASDVEVVRESLLELQKIPEEVRCEPEDYDDEHPENFPPPVGITMVRR